MAAWFAQEFQPYDHWMGWTRYDPDTPDRVTRTDGDSPGPDMRYLERTLEEMHDVAIVEFGKLGWEGDGEWHYTGFISGETPGPDFLLAVKQFNNGAVYVLSPVPLHNAV
jgi:hypothetical protein